MLEAAREGHGNARFEARDLSRFDEEAEPGAFDLVTSFDAIHDQARPMVVLRGIRRSLADGGVYLAQDVKGSSHHHLNRDHPLGTLIFEEYAAGRSAKAIALGLNRDGIPGPRGGAWGPSTIHGQRRVLVFAGGESNPPTGGLLCIDPANGHVDFTVPFRSRSYESVNASCPVVFDSRGDSSKKIASA